MKPPTPPTAGQECAERVRVAGLRWPTYKPCQRAGKVERDGKWYCGIHDPVAVAGKREAKNKEWDAKYQRERQQEQRKWDCIRGCDGIENPAESVPAMLAFVKECAWDCDDRISGGLKQKAQDLLSTTTQPRARQG